MLAVDLNETTTVLKQRKKEEERKKRLANPSSKVHFYTEQKAAQITYLQNKFLFTLGILHISMGNFIDLGKSPLSKKVINIDQQRTLGDR